MPLRRITGLWLGKSKSGQKYMSGKTDVQIGEGVKLLIFRNDKRQSDTDPDYILHASIDDEPDELAQVAVAGGMDVPW